MPPTPFPTRHFKEPIEMPDTANDNKMHNSTVSLWFGNPENWMPKQFLGVDELAEFADFVIKQYKEEQPEQPEIFKATKHGHNWRIELDNDPAIFVQFPSLPVAITEMKRKVKLDKILIEF